MFLQIILSIRHWLYNHQFLKSQHWAKGKTLVIGNLELGGSGKTPHTLYFLEKLNPSNPVFLSRGYGRNSKGFQIITEESTPETIGDEPKLILQKIGKSFRGAVCTNRIDGLYHLSNRYPDSKIAILDDAFQHRKLIPDCTILITPANRPFWKNKLFPKGSLRDLPQRAQLADLIVVSQCPTSFNYDDFLKEVPLPWKSKIVFSRYFLQEPIEITSTAISYSESKRTLAISGLAQNDRFKKQENPYLHLQFKDHQQYAQRHVDEIRKIVVENQIEQIITTEKDGVKLKILLLDDPLSIPVFVRPIGIQWINQAQEEKVLSVIQSKLFPPLSNSPQIFES
jgi:tetraacyldisaccharide 4'-kinase